MGMGSSSHMETVELKSTDALNQERGRTEDT